MFFKNLCLGLMLLSLIFMLAQQELLYIIFSLLFFIICSLGLLSFYNVEFLILVLFIIYVGVIVVLFLFTVMIYNLPKLELTSDILGLLIVAVGLFVFGFGVDETISAVVVSGIDILWFVEFINEQITMILLCGLLLLISILTSLLIIFILDFNDN